MAAITKTNIIAGEMPSIATRTFDDVKNYFRRQGENTEKNVTSAIDLGMCVIESAAPVPGGKGKPAITDKGQLSTLYNELLSGRKIVSVGKFDASDKKAKTAVKKQLEKLEACFGLATGNHKDHAVRIATDTYQLLLGNKNTGEAGIGGRVYSSLISVVRAHANDKLAKPMTRAEIKAFLEGDDKDDTVYAYDVLKKLDDSMAREAGQNAKNLPAVPLPKDALTAVLAARAELGPALAAALAVKTKIKADLAAKKAAAELAAAKKAAK